MEEIIVEVENRRESTLVQSLQEKIDQLNSVIALLPGHVYWMDLKGVYLGCNDKQAHFVKLDSREQIVGKHYTDFLPPQNAEVIGGTNYRVMQSGEPYYGEETSEIPGYEGIYLSHKVPLRDKQGKIIGLLGVSFDITERKKMEKELQEAREKAEIANQVKTEFIRNMEHDIRTPLCGIMSVANHLNAMEQDLSKKDFLNELEIAANELLNYLDNIVEFSQMNSGTVPLIFKPFNLEQMLNGIIKLESAAAKHKGLELIVEYSAAAPKFVVSDRFRLHRILINLVNNAIKFTEQGYIRIRVTVAEEKPDENQVLLDIAVEDTGIGIEKKHQEFIYDKFTRCDLANKGIYKGTGLGLWIVRQFINELKGDIRLESEVGIGSVFTCRFPVSMRRNY